MVDTHSRQTSGSKGYQQLGAQLSLERFILGHPLDPSLNDPPFWLDFFDLTLESGLDEPEGLVKLQELSVMSLSHVIGVSRVRMDGPTLADVEEAPHLLFAMSRL